MSWKKELKPASLNGIPFRVDAVSTEFGWNTQIRDVQSDSGTGFPKKKSVNESSPDIEIGTKKPKIFSIDAHFSGDDYLLNRDAFIRAIELGGTMSLQLPLMPLLKVVASRATIVYSNTAGGYETVRAQFIETVVNKYPLITENFKRLGESLVSSIRQALINGMAESFSPSVDGSAELAEKLSGDILSVAGFGAAGDTFSDFIGSAVELSENARTIIQTPQRFAEQVMDTIGQIRYAFVNPVDAFSAQLHIFDTYRENLEFSLNGSESRRLQVDNNLAVAMAVENAALATAGLSAMDAQFDTLNDAVQYRKRFEEYVRIQQSRNGEYDGYDEIYRDLSILLGRVTEYVNNAAGLPSSTQIVINSSSPSLVIVGDYYGDSGRYDEFLTRNKVQHPLFVDGSVEVLSS